MKQLTKIMFIITCIFCASASIILNYHSAEPNVPLIIFSIILPSCVFFGLFVNEAAETW